jgi:flagellar biosynthesis anti-sigma factor FlgM
MKISDINKTLQVQRAERAQGTKGNDAAKQRGVADTVSLRSKAELDSLTDTVMNAEVQDPEFEELKAAIREGRYEPDLDRLADRILGEPETFNALLGE